MSETLKQQPKTWFSRFLLNEKMMLIVIPINTIVIFIEESGAHSPFLLLVDLTCTVVFLLEMIVKHIYLGFKGYWSSRWNRFDGILVLMSLPSLVMVFLPLNSFDFSILLIFRLFRIMRFFRLVRFFPNLGPIVNNLRLAFRQTYAIFFAFFVIIIVFGLLNCVLYRGVAPQYFGTPLHSIYSVFRLCTVEGWYEIPDAIAAVTSPFWSNITRVYFSFFLLLAGIIGMSIINSIFVDAMVSDNNDDVKAQLLEMEKKIDRLIEENEQLKSKQ